MLRVSKTLRHAASLLICAAAGCSSGDSGSSEPTLRENLIQYPLMYTAAGGSQSYRITPSVPLVAAGPALDPVQESSLVWTVDKAVLEDEGPFTDLPGGRMLKALKSGTTVIKVTGTTASGVKVRGEATVQISTATDEQWQAGDDRYTKGDSIDWNSLFMMNAPQTGSTTTTTTMGDCGLPVSIPSGQIKATTACTNCHDAGNAISVQHTPTQTSLYPDEALIQIFTKAMKPDGAHFNSPGLAALEAMGDSGKQQAQCVYGKFHTWDIAPETRQGVVLKLRSIMPMKQTQIDMQRIIADIQAQMAANAAGSSGGTAGKGK